MHNISCILHSRYGVPGAPALFGVGVLPQKKSKTLLNKAPARALSCGARLGGGGQTLIAGPSVKSGNFDDGPMKGSTSPPFGISPGDEPIRAFPGPVPMPVIPAERAPDL